MGWVTAEHPTTEELAACVQCGLCLPVCPTFRLTGRETASPRGRLHAMSAVHGGVVEVDRAFASLIDFCLGCRACEPVCPGLVPYGRALEGTRAEIVAQVDGGRSWRNRAVYLGVSRRSATRLGSAILSALQAARLGRLTPRPLRRLLAGLRPLGSRPRPALGHSGGSGSAGTVGLLTGCVQDEWFRPVNQAAITLLEMAGYRVEAPRAQVCCGALSAHDGDAAAAHSLARRNEDEFEGYDLVVSTAAGCSAHLAGYEHWARDGSISHRARDITVVVARAIAEGRLPSVARSAGRVAIQDPCHLRHAQRVIAEPRAILEAGGYEPVEIDPLALCCGAAGLYTVLQPEASAALGNQKATQIRSTGVTRVASANPGCEMQLRAHLSGEYEIRHPVEWYLRSLADGDPGVRVRG